MHAISDRRTDDAIGPLAVVAPRVSPSLRLGSDDLILELRAQAGSAVRGAAGDFAMTVRVRVRAEGFHAIASLGSTARSIAAFGAELGDCAASGGASPRRAALRTPTSVLMVSALGAGAEPRLSADIGVPDARVAFRIAPVAMSWADLARWIGWVDAAVKLAPA